MKKVASLKSISVKHRSQPPLSTQRVHFELFSPGARKVCIAGTFNDWEPETGQMSQQSDGKWVRNLTLKPGTYEYRFVVDGKWEPDPSADHTILNPYGEKNSLLTVLAATASASSRDNAD